MGSSTKQQKDDQVMDAKTEKAAKDVKKRETEENKDFKERLINAITPRFLEKQREKNEALEDAAKELRCGGKVHKMKKGGKVKKGYHKMPDGKIMKDSAHKKQSKCKRDGICVRGKTKGRMV